MRFLAAERLWLLLALAALVAAYVLVQARRSRYAVRFTNLKLLERVAPTTPGWRRHVPAGLFLAMLALFLTAFAQPSAQVQVPRERATIVVALDVSPSMMAGDVAPDRLSAAKQSARAFVEQLPERFQVGLVSFARSGSAQVAPTTDRDALLGAIDRLAISSTGGTAIGDAITTSLNSIASLDEQAAEDPPPARIVLLSDGGNTAGQPPEQAAAQAARAAVPVFTIAFGTPDGAVNLNGRQLAVPVDGDTLRGIAGQTGGEFYEASSGEELSDVYADIGSSIGYRTEWREISAWFVGLGLLTSLAVAATSLLWFSRLP
jgi:Ca-activated chloride channel family protein